MGKALLWIVIILAALTVARIVSRQSASRKHPRASGKTAAKKAEAMVRCEHCGIHLPRSDALLLDGKTWCSSDHAKLGQ